MGALQDSIGTGLTNLDNWTAEGGTAATNLSRYDGALRAYYACDDAAGTFCTAKRLGLGGGLYPQGSASLGNTSIIGTGTSMAVGASDTVESTVTGPEGSGNQYRSFSLSWWYKTSEAEPSGWGLAWGWNNGSSTGRLQFGWLSNNWTVIHDNTTTALYAPGGDWSGDVGDGTAHHVAVTYSGLDTTLKFYHDNILEYSNSSFNVTSEIARSCLSWGQPGASISFPGNTAHFAVWDDCLSAAAVSELAGGRFLQPIA